MVMALLAKANFLVFLWTPIVMLSWYVDMNEVDGTSEGFFFLSEVEA